MSAADEKRTPQPAGVSTTKRAYKRRPRVYVAGPITDTPGYQKAFEQVAETLRSMGVTPVNPATGAPPDLTYKEYIDRGLNLLARSDAICLLPAWQRSTGAKLERMYAETVGLQILYAVTLVDGSVRVLGRLK